MGIRVAIVDDHEAIRLGFGNYCIQQNVELVGSAATVDELLEQIQGKDCAVVVTDLSLSDGSSVTENVSRLVAAGPAVLIFSIADKPSLMRAAVRAGATAIVPKSQPMEALFQAIELASQGAIINNAETTATIDSDASFKEASLSAREREVL